MVSDTVDLKTLRWMALILAVGGMLLLHRAARQRELPLLTADGLSPSMQFATVRAAGRVVRPARIHRRDGEVSVVTFSLQDGTGELQAVAFGDVARALADAARLPRPEDLVEIVGVLQFSTRYGPQIHLRSAEDVVMVVHSTATERLP